MITQNIKKLKKYLFFISIMFFVLTFIHLGHTYLYSNSKNLPVKGGTISEGLVGNIPSLNPLVPLYDTNDKYVIGLLYRSLLKYDINQHKIVGDITKCDISSILNIECIINEDAKWSNGEKITTEDIVSTYDFIKETGSNKILVSLLNEAQIEVKDENTILFINTKKDINFLNVFLQPILNKEIINSLSKENVTGKFPITGGIYSGKFVIEKVSEDENLGITKFHLVKNEHYNSSNISKIILNIFSDINSFKKNYNAVNVFNDSDNSIGNSIYKFQNQKYTLNSFIGLFLNQNNIKNKELRTYILNKLETEKLIKVLGGENYEVISNPFLTTESISRESTNKNFDSLMYSLGYKKKSALVAESLPKKEEVKKEEKVVETPKIEEKKEEKPKEIVIPEDLTLDRYQKDSKTIFSPEYVDIYNFISKDDVLLKGRTEGNVTAVYVNDYKLAGYKSGNKEFYYRLKESVGNLKAGNNSYKIYFEIGGEKKFQEELNFVYYHDKNKLKEEEKNLAISLYKKEKEAEIAKQAEEEKKLAEVKKEEIKKEEIKTGATEEKKVEEVVKVDEKLNNLDERLYYNKELQAFSLKLYYIEDGKKDTKDTVKFIEDSLKELGITVNSTSFSVKELAKIITNKDEYDMILTGIHPGYLNFNLFPYFHSSQAKTGYNFTNIRKPALDLLVEEMKENIYTEEKTKELQKKILEILKDEQVLKTLYTPKINLLVDKSIKIEQKYSSLPYKSERTTILENAYIKEEKVLNLSDKSITGFFKFLLKKFYE